MDDRGHFHEVLGRALTDESYREKLTSGDRRKQAEALQEVTKEEPSKRAARRAGQGCRCVDGASRTHSEMESRRRKHQALAARSEPCGPKHSVTSTRGTCRAWIVCLPSFPAPLSAGQARRVRPGAPILGDRPIPRHLPGQRPGSDALRRRLAAPRPGVPPGLPATKPSTALRRIGPPRDPHAGRGRHARPGIVHR